jgi:hypothetical protein
VRGHLGLDVVQHFALGLHKDGHVQEDLVQVQQALLQLANRLPPLLYLRQCVQHLQARNGSSQGGPPRSATRLLASNG